MKSIRIKSIKQIPPKRVYALETTAGTFIADGVLHHNCKNCNLWYEGNKPEYAEFMLKKYGVPVIEELNALRRALKPLTIEDLKNLKDKYSK